jgi:hypothetical protein
MEIEAKKVNHNGDNNQDQPLWEQASNTLKFKGNFDAMEHTHRATRWMDGWMDGCIKVDGKKRG